MMKDKSVLVSLSVIFIIIGIFSYVAVYPTYDSRDNWTQYAVIFKPGTDRILNHQKVIQAGGLPVRDGTFDFIMITASEDRNFPRLMKNKGAVFVFSAIIKGGCFVENKSRFQNQKK